MVSIALGFGRNGLQDWLFQRITAVILGAYFIFIFSQIVSQPDLDFYTWNALFSGTGMKFFSHIALFSLVAHTWIGLWTISTDYLKPLWVRLPFQMFVNLVLIGYLIWGVSILWSI